jgi:hypothetical protein
MTEIDVYRPGQLDTVQDRAVQRIADWAHAADAAYAIATKLVQSSFVPVAFRGKAVEATAAILAGAEVGISPMSALRAFDVIQGVAAPRAITLRAIAQSFGHDIEITETNSTRCTVRGRRKGGERWQSLSWTIDRARDLGLLGKDQWKKQPAAMLIARATAEMARLIAADAILGIGYSAEEVADGTTDEPAATEPTPGVRRMSRTPSPVERRSNRTRPDHPPPTHEAARDVRRPGIRPRQGPRVHRRSARVRRRIVERADQRRGVALHRRRGSQAGRPCLTSTTTRVSPPPNWTVSTRPACPGVSLTGWPPTTCGAASGTEHESRRTVRRLRRSGPGSRGSIRRIPGVVLRV